MGATKSGGEPVILFDESPPAETRAELARQIHGFHGRTMPFEQNRFGLRVVGGDGALLAGLTGVVSWTWLYVESVWVDDALRGKGVGRALMARAEDEARARGCHSVWLDTFQARAFYEALGYEAFGVLDDYPAGQSRAFMKKRL